MICSICGNENASGKFCEKCGSRLQESGIPAETLPERQATGTVVEEVNPELVPVQTGIHQPAANTAADNGYAYYNSLSSDTQEKNEQPVPMIPEGTAREAEPNPYLETIKKNSKMYFHYFAAVLKNPYAFAQRINGEQWINGMITMLIAVLMLPLLTYFTLGSERLFWIENPFVSIVIKPFFGLVILYVLLALFTFGAVKLSTNPAADVKSVIARFGALLVPFVLLYAVGFLFFALKLSIAGAFFLISFIGSIITPCSINSKSYSKFCLTCICILRISIINCCTLLIFSCTLYCIRICIFI